MNRGMREDPALVEQVESAAAAGTKIHFVDDAGSVSSHDLAAIVADAQRMACGLEERFGVNATIAALLEASPSCLTLILGALFSGQRLVSLPLPARGSPLEVYEAQVLETCAIAEASTVVVPARYSPVVPELPIPLLQHETLPMSDRHLEGDPADATLVQFTSGSSGDPRGIVLPVKKVAANIESILHVIQPSEGDVPCSWLPWSHDMGLIGMLLGSLCGASRQWAGGGDMVFMLPEYFVRRPHEWIELCSRFAATISAGPDFGLRMAVAAAQRGGSPDLTAMRVFILGSEPVRAPSLREFADVFSGAGFSPRAFCPAYGLAEAALAVTLTPPAHLWSSRNVDEAALAEGTVRLVPKGAGREVVSSGVCLPQYSIHVDSPPGGVGVLRISGPSLLDAYLDSAGSSSQAGWHTTSDLAFQQDGELFVTGRIDDVLLVSGRKVYLSDIDASVERAGLCRPGGAMAAPLKGEGYIVAVEHSPDFAEGPAALARLVRRVAARAVAVGPDAVLVVERRSLPRTTSGKPRRAELARRSSEETLGFLHRSQYSTPG